MGRAKKDEMMEAVMKDPKILTSAPGTADKMPTVKSSPMKKTPEGPRPEKRTGYI